MMRMVRQLVSGLAVSACLLAPVRAETLFLTPDPGHTQIMFSVMHLGLSRTYGAFDSFEGRVVLDTNRPETLVAELTIDVASLDSGFQARDDNLMGSLWFDADTHPTMAFAATGLALTGETTGTLTGDLTLLGVTRPVNLDVIFNGQGADPFSSRKTRYGFSATGQIKRSDFGMDFGLDFVGDDIDLMIETELLQSDDG
jgi:polyisoprenoid-binding protein YceI